MYVGNYFILDFVVVIKVEYDDLLVIDLDESLFYGKLGGFGGCCCVDDDDNQMEVFGEDDDSLNSVFVDGMVDMKFKGVEEEKEFFVYVCVYVCLLFGVFRFIC